ncbi:MAG: hypothetical protein JJE17_00920 [Peptostreptococcaceae bacterium]|nr:hypothetical protein [Peptostreptococcaceae bacterium]
MLHNSASFKTFVAGMDVIRNNDGTEQAARFYGTGLFARDTSGLEMFTDDTLSISQYTYSTNALKLPGSYVSTCLTKMMRIRFGL